MKKLIILYLILLLMACLSIKTKNDFSFNRINKKRSIKYYFINKKEFNEKLEILAEYFYNNGKIKIISNYKGYGLDCFIINDYFTFNGLNNKFAEISDNLYATYNDIINEIYTKKIYTINEIEKIYQIKYNDFIYYLDIMHDLNLNSIFRIENIYLEITYELPIADSSLNEYAGYIYSPVNIVPKASQNNYISIEKIKNKFYKFQKKVKR